ncbi:hypothetical protein QR98_0018510 [Sarcoptes scabiei]|nr:hypothetical protein QR98_0018510 [Sarcoptes scabiei]
MESLMTDQCMFAARSFFGPTFGLPPMPGYPDLTEPRMANFLRERAMMFGFGGGPMPGPNQTTPPISSPNSFMSSTTTPVNPQSQISQINGPNNLPVESIPFGLNVPPMYYPIPSGNKSTPAQSTPSIPVPNTPTMEQLNQIFLQNQWYALMANSAQTNPSGRIPLGSSISGPLLSTISNGTNLAAQLAANPQLWAAAFYGSNVHNNLEQSKNDSLTKSLIASPEMFLKTMNENRVMKTLPSNDSVMMELSPNSKSNDSDIKIPISSSKSTAITASTTTFLNTPTNNSNRSLEKSIKQQSTEATA